MFVQVIQGQVSDPEQVHAALNRWSEQLAAGAPGWLGSTAGVTEDGRRSSGSGSRTAPWPPARPGLPGHGQRPLLGRPRASAQRECRGG
jgi:hypothetical protein